MQSTNVGPMSGNIKHVKFYWSIAGVLLFCKKKCLSVKFQVFLRINRFFLNYIDKYYAWLKDFKNIKKLDNDSVGVVVVDILMFLIGTHEIQIYIGEIIMKIKKWKKDTTVDFWTKSYRDSWMERVKSFFFFLSCFNMGLKVVSPVFIISSSPLPFRFLLLKGGVQNLVLI